MRIIIDARMYNMSGIGRYIRNIINKNEFINDIVLMGYENEIKSQKLINFNSKIYGIGEQLKFPYKEIKKQDILHIPHYNIPLFYHGHMLTTIHDITHVLFPEYLPNKFALYYAKFMISMAIKKSKYIFTVSENTKKDLIHYFNADENKIIVTYNGVDKSFIKKDKKDYDYLYEKYNIDKSKKILLYVGNKKPHKNIVTLIKAMSLLNKNENYILILSGKGFEGYTELENLTIKLGLEKNIVHTGIVTDEELVDLYNLADVFVFLSLYEGFGIPVLESMACGTPVICSNTSSLPEVVGDSAIQIDPLNPSQIATSIEEVLKNKELYNNLVIKGYDRVSKFTWEDCRLKTESIYKKVIDSI